MPEQMLTINSKETYLTSSEILTFLNTVNNNS